MLLTFFFHALLNLLLSNYTLVYAVPRFHSPVSCGSFESEMWENADISFSSLPTPGALLHLHPCLSLNLPLSFSFTLWMVHLAYMTRWIHNPQQFKIPWRPVGIKWNHISIKDCCTAICSSLFIQRLLFHAVDKHALPMTHMAVHNKVLENWFPLQFSKTTPSDSDCTITAKQRWLRCKAVIRCYSSLIPPHVETMCMRLWQETYFVSKVWII